VCAFYTCTRIYIYIILRARWAERKALFAAVVAIRADAVYNGCTITMHARLYILLESESEREQEGELEREQSPYIWSLFQKDPFSLDFFFSRPMTRLPGLKAPEYARTRTHTHTHIHPGWFLRRGRFMERRVFMAVRSFFLLLLFRSCGVDKQVCPPPPMSRTHFDRNA